MTHLLNRVRSIAVALVALSVIAIVPCDAFAHHGRQAVQVQRVRVREPVFARRAVTVQRFVAPVHRVQVQQVYAQPIVVSQPLVYSQAFVAPQPIIVQQEYVDPCVQTQGIVTQSFQFSY